MLRTVLAYLLVLISSATALHAQTFQITGATYGTPASSTIPAGVNGAALTLSGTLPTATQISQLGLLGCFYTGYGSTTGIALSGGQTLTVPASTIQSVPQSSFTAANGYAVTALVYFIQSPATCTGTFSATLTNQFSVKLIAPSLGTFNGPANVPQTNAATGVQAPPTALTLPATGFGASGGATTITFGSFGSLTPVLHQSSLSIIVPAAFSSSPPGTTASLSICNTFTGASVCTTPTPPITLTVTALETSTATVSAAPNPVLTSGQAVLTAHVAASPSQTGNPGAPSGTVAFTAAGTPLTAPLILDKTATFAAQTTSPTTPSTAAPVINPATGSFSGSQTVSISDAAPGAVFYYTQNGATPTTASTQYAGPFTVAATETINAIAVAPGDLSSSVATATLTIRPPTQLAFVVQPSNTQINTAIAPAVQVAVEDSTTAVVTGSSAPVTIGILANPGQSVLGGSTTVNAVNGIATFSNLTLNNVATGYTLTATSPSLTSATSTAFNITPVAITMNVQSALVGIGSTLSGTFTLGVAAPAGGLVVTLASSVPGNATISPATVTIPAGQSTGSFTYTGVAAGSSILSASATGYSAGTATVTGTAAQVSLGAIPNVAPGQMVSLALSLATPAPAGGTTVTFTVANSNIATITSSVFVPAGSQTPTANPQITGVLIGTTTVTANAPGYAPATRTATVTVTAAVNPATTNINLSTSTNTVLTISAPAPAGGITFTLQSANTGTATVPASVTVIAGATSVPIPITGVAAGTTTISASSTGITTATGTVTVSSAIPSSTLITGYDLENNTYISLPVAPPNPTTITVISNNPAVAIISTGPAVVGQTTLTFPNITSSGVGYIYVQGLTVGTTTLTVSGPGYTSGTITINVYPTGFVYEGAPTLSTTTLSPPTSLTIYTAPLIPTTLAPYTYGFQINPGSAAISVPVTSSVTGVGTVISPIVFQPGASYANATFTPVGVGTSTVALGTPPAGFAVPSQGQQAAITVALPQIAPNAAPTGVKLQVALNIQLPQTPPASGVTVTVTTSAPAVATLSNSQTVAGVTTLTFNNVTTENVGTIYVQGQSQGSATLTVSAPGYTSGTSTLSVANSGFAYYGSPTINTTTFSGTTSETVYTVTLTPNATVSAFQLALNPGVGPLSVSITDSSTATGTVSPNPVVFNTGDTNQSYNFQPLAAGTANLTIQTPTGFTTPIQYQVAAATVTAPQITVNPVTTGVALQIPTSISLPVAPPSPVTVTVSVPPGTFAPAPALLSNSSTVAGGTSLTFTNVTTAFVGNIYIQGQTVGSTTMTVSAPGYTSGSGTLTVNPSGFFFDSSTALSTTTFSTATSLPIYTAVLTPSTLVIQNYGLQINPGAGPFTVPITDSATTVGTVSANSVVFSAGDVYHQISFQPVSAGTAILSLTTPAGFSTPSADQAVTATVTAPQIVVNPSTPGVNLETPLGIFLPVAPPNPVTVTVTSNGPAIATISSSGTVVGGSTLTFPNVSGTSVGTIYVQGQATGSTTITESAPGYTNGNGTVTVDPSGFVLVSSSFTTTATSTPTSLTVYTSVLNPGTLTIEQYGLALNPGIGNVSVPLTSSNTTVGTISLSPLVFTPGSTTVSSTFQPLATGTSNITVGTPSTPAGFSTASQDTQITATVQ